MIKITARPLLMRKSFSRTESDRAVSAFAPLFTSVTDSALLFNATNVTVGSKMAKTLKGGRSVSMVCV